jgi:DNA-binding response OmpR family regulator
LTKAMTFHSDTSSAHSPKVILVDDDKDAREFIAAALETCGCSVLQAANGIRLISSLHVDRPDVILLDVNLSWVDGFELCRSVHQNELFKDIPVVFISGRTSPSDIAKGKDVGGADYFVKPVSIEQLVERVRQLAKQK